MSEHIAVFITASGEEEAARIARALVEERLAGCVNVVPGIRSIYIWQGAVQNEKEVLMMVKTKKALFGRLSARVKELHSYTVPEVIAISISQGSDDYLKWLDEVTL